jgi:hypothetical protein
MRCRICLVELGNRNINEEHLCFECNSEKKSREEYKDSPYYNTDYATD